MGRAKKSYVEYHRTHRRYNFIRIWQRRYSHMLARHEGRSTNASGAAGKGICSKKEFFEWCMAFENFETFLSLYYDWAASDFPMHLSPSIDRVDSNKGYSCDNLQWLSFEENCRKNNINPVDHTRGGW